MNSRYGVVKDIRPLFLSGVYRAGTTILTQIVNNHPDFAITYDSVKFLRFCLDRYDPIQTNWKRLIQETFLRINKRWNMEFDVESVIQEVGSSREISYATVYIAIMRHLILLKDRKAKHWGEKIAVMWSRIPDFLSMFPGGRVIHIFRDPRDLTASYKKMTYEPGYIFLDAAFNCLHAMVNLKKFQKEFGNDKIFLLRMEDLLDNPEEETRRICNFLEVEFSKSILDAGSFKDKAGEKWLHNSAFDNQMSGISRNYSRWEQFLTKAETIFVEMITQPQMVEYGYEPSGLMPDKKDWDEMYSFIADPFLKERFQHWLSTGEGVEGYASDPLKADLEYLQAALEEIENIK